MKILVGFRGKNVGQDLLQLAARRARAFDGETIVVTSLFGGDKTDSEQIAEAEQNLKEAQAFFDKQGLTCQTHLLVRGQTPGEDLVNYARETGAEEIIIGVKSRSKVGKLLFGSTAQYVILKAACPVTSVK
jgi:nucleotide-binding universal stress UspA family protein